MKHSDMLKSAYRQERKLSNSPKFSRSGVMRRITYTLLVGAVVLLGLLLMNCGREQPDREQPNGEPRGGPAAGSSFDSAIAINTNSFTEGAISPAGDNDYYRIELSNDVSLHIYITGITGIYGQFYDSARNEITTGYDIATGTDFSISQPFSAGTYYIRIRHSRSDGTGNYGLSVIFINQPVGGECTGSGQCVSGLHCYNRACRASQPVDGQCTGSDHCASMLHCYNSVCRARQTDGGSCTSSPQCANGLPCLNNLCQLPVLGTVAMPIAIDSTFDAAIDPVGDNDYYEIVIASAVNVNIYTTGSTDTYGYLYDNSGNDLTADNDSGMNSNFSISRSLSAGTYYIRIVHSYFFSDGNLYLLGTGPYRLHVDSR